MNGDVARCDMVTASASTPRHAGSAHCDAPATRKKLSHESVDGLLKSCFVGRKFGHFSPLCMGIITHQHTTTGGSENNVYLSRSSLSSSLSTSFYPHPRGDDPKKIKKIWKMKKRTTIYLTTTSSSSKSDRSTRSISIGQSHSVNLHPQSADEEHLHVPPQASHPSCWRTASPNRRWTPSQQARPERHQSD